MPIQPRPGPWARRPYLLVAGLVAGLVLAGCTGGDGDEAAAPASPTPAPTTSPSPTFEVQPVDGAIDTGQIGVDSSFILAHGETAAPDQDGIDAMVAATKRWLDTHLDRLQRQRRGLLGRTVSQELLDATSSALRDAVSVRLASPERPVAAAHYEIRVYYDPGPLWAGAHVTTRAPDGSTAKASFVFLPHEPVVPVMISADTPEGREEAGTPPTASPGGGQSGTDGGEEGAG